MKVEYRPVPGWPGYAVGSDRSAWSSRSGPFRRRGWVRLLPNADGRVGLSVGDGSRRYFRPEDLVGLAWPEGPPPRPFRTPEGEAATGSANPRARLTEADVAELRRLRIEDPRRWTYPALAVRFGVCRSTVRNVLSGRTWSHVGPAAGVDPDLECPAGPMRTD